MITPSVMKELKKTGEYTHSKGAQKSMAEILTEHCVKSVQIRNFFWSVFSECGKIRTRKNSIFGHFSDSGSSKLSYNLAEDNCHKKPCSLYNKK